ncbi:hypothetical protein Mro03_44890 [Microbispora rosea subsp. rosea]|nr:hypothetical protein Mro03_44890 [Microbispora rosea subsp. rosea]
MSAGTIAEGMLTVRLPACDLGGASTIFSAIQVDELFPQAVRTCVDVDVRAPQRDARLSELPYLRWYRSGAPFLMVSQICWMLFILVGGRARG